MVNDSTRSLLSLYLYHSTLLLRNCHAAAFAYGYPTDEFTRNESTPSSKQMAIASTIRNEMNSSICNPSHAYNKHTKQLGKKRLDCSAIVQQGACLDQILLYGLLHEGVKLHTQRNLCIIQWLHSSPPYENTACTTSSQYKWNHFRSGSSP